MPSIKILFLNFTTFIFKYLLWCSGQQAKLRWEEAIEKAYKRRNFHLKKMFIYLQNRIKIQDVFSFFN